MQFKESFEGKYTIANNVIIVGCILEFSLLNGLFKYSDNSVDNSGSKNSLETS